MSTTDALAYLLQSGEVSSWRQDPDSQRFTLAGPGMFWSGLTGARLIEFAGYCQRQAEFVGAA